MKGRNMTDPKEVLASLLERHKELKSLEALNPWERDGDLWNQIIAISRVDGNNDIPKTLRWEIFGIEQTIRVVRSRIWEDKNWRSI
jgi:hypothetical protein